MSVELQSATTRQYCTFLLEGMLFGVEASRVQEVLRFQEITAVPRAPRSVRGLLNLRGEIVTAIDLRRRLSLPDRVSARLPINVVLRDGTGAVSLLVDEIGDVIDVEPATFERAPQTLQGAFRELVQAACQLGDRLLLVLDIERAIAPASL